MTLIDFSVLDANMGRYVVVAEAFIPVLLAICCGLSTCKKTHHSKIRRASLAIFYLIVSLLWGFSLFISSMNFDNIALIVFAVISALLLLGCIYLAMYFPHQHSLLATIILNFLVLLGAVAAMTSPATDNYAAMTVAMTFVPVGLAIALGLNHSRLISPPLLQEHMSHP